MLVNSQLVCLPSVEIFDPVNSSFEMLVFLSFSLIGLLENKPVVACKQTDHIQLTLISIVFNNRLLDRCSPSL